MISSREALLIQERYNAGEHLYDLLKEVGVTNQNYNDAIHLYYQTHTDTIVARNLIKVAEAEKRLFELADLINESTTHPDSKARFNVKFDRLKVYFSKAEVNGFKLCYIPNELLR